MNLFDLLALHFGKAKGLPRHVSSPPHISPLSPSLRFVFLCLNFFYLKGIVPTLPELMWGKRENAGDQDETNAAAGLFFLFLARGLWASFHEGDERRPLKLLLPGCSSRNTALWSNDGTRDAGFLGIKLYTGHNSGRLLRVCGDTSHQGGTKDEWLMRLLLPVLPFKRSGRDKSPTDRFLHSLKNSLQSFSFPASAQMLIRICHHGCLGGPNIHVRWLRYGAAFKNLFFLSFSSVASVSTYLLCCQVIKTVKVS